MKMAKLYWKKRRAKSRQMSKTVRRIKRTFNGFFDLMKRSQARQYYLSYCLMTLTLFFLDLMPEVRRLMLNFWPFVDGLFYKTERRKRPFILSYGKKCAHMANVGTMCLICLNLSFLCIRWGEIKEFTREKRGNVKVRQIQDRLNFICLI